MLGDIASRNETAQRFAPSMWAARKAMEISYTAPDFVQSVINRLGRTEDLRFSPSNKRLAVSEFSNK
jgi:hypothetical protein